MAQTEETWRNPTSPLNVIRYETAFLWSWVGKTFLGRKNIGEDEKNLKPASISTIVEMLLKYHVAKVFFQQCLILFWLRWIQRIFFV